MNNLKFRAWHKKEKKHYEVCALNFYVRKACIGIPYNNKWVSFDDLVIEQYAGLKDKYSKEIYVGDIVKSPGAIFEVKSLGKLSC